MGRNGLGLFTRILIGALCVLGVGAGAAAAGVIPIGGHHRMRAEPAETAPGSVGERSRSTPGPSARPAWVAVPVATIWDLPGQARPIDSAATTANADVGAWVSTMSVNQKLALDNLLATQALLYDPVMVIGQSGTWDHVIVLGQKGAVYPSGIVGWVPESQLPFRAPPQAAGSAIVEIPVLGVGPMNLSYGTHVPVSPDGPRTDDVMLPSGSYKVAASYLRTSPLAPTGQDVVAQAKQFLGLPLPV